NFLSCITRPAVLDEILKIWIILSQHAVDGFGYETSLIERGRHNRYARRSLRRFLRPVMRTDSKPARRILASNPQSRAKHCAPGLRSARSRRRKEKLALFEVSHAPRNRLVRANKFGARRFVHRIS